jgi:photosystem II stability/assembly factor-like uncharacterized protein
MQIYLLAYLLFSQCFVECRQYQENALVSTAGITFQSSDRKHPETSRPVAVNTLFQSTDGGQTWQDISAGLPGDLEISRIFSTRGEIYWSALSGLYHNPTPPANPEWKEEVFPGRDITDMFRGESISDIFPGQCGLYASSYENGLFEKKQGTNTWQPIGNTLKDKTISTLLEAPDGAIFVGCQTGMYKSADNGKTWKRVFKEGFILSLLTADGALVAGGYRGLFRSTDGGEHWDQVMETEGAAAHTTWIDGKIVTIIVDGTTNRLYTSADSGKTWQVMDESLSQIWSVYDIRQTGGFLLCNTNAGIFRSSDQGKSWELVLPANEGKSFNMTVSGLVVYALITDVTQRQKPALRF